MSGYRFFLIGPDGRIFHGVEAECADDEDALAQARALQGRLEVEVWQGKRCVGRAPAWDGDR